MNKSSNKFKRTSASIVLKCQFAAPLSFAWSRINCVRYKIPQCLMAKDCKKAQVQCNIIFVFSGISYNYLMGESPENSNIKANHDSSFQYILVTKVSIRKSREECFFTVMY